MATTLQGAAGGVETATESRGSWRDVVAPYQQTEVVKSIVQLVVTLGLLAAGFTAMALSLSGPYWITLLIGLPTAGLLVRSFIIMHDCSHSSFLPWRGANDAIGWVTGILTMTPFDQWRRDHAIHHASSGDLDRRGHGDVDTITVREYLARSPRERLQYRLKRHPVALLLVGPLWLMWNQRFRPRSKATKDKQISSVLWTNIAIVSVVAAFALAGLLPEFLMVYFPAIYIAGMAGVFLFYVQHQFEETYWAQHGEWDYLTASISGSSYLKLPKPLAWMTGDIGVHHVHHLSPKIPNYKLQECHDQNPIFHKVTTLTLKDTWKPLWLSLWDEEQGKLISFKDLEKRTSQQA